MSASSIGRTSVVSEIFENANLRRADFSKDFTPLELSSAPEQLFETTRADFVPAGSVISRTIKDGVLKAEMIDVVPADGNILSRKIGSERWDDLLAFVLRISGGNLSSIPVYNQGFEPESLKGLTFRTIDVKAATTAQIQFEYLIDSLNKNQLDFLRYANRRFPLMMLTSAAGWKATASRVHNLLMTMGVSTESRNAALANLIVAGQAMNNAFVQFREVLLKEGSMFSIAASLMSGGTTRFTASEESMEGGVARAVIWLLHLAYLTPAPFFSNFGSILKSINQAMHTDIEVSEVLATPNGVGTETVWESDRTRHWVGGANDIRGIVLQMMLRNDPIPQLATTQFGQISFADYYQPMTQAMLNDRVRSLDRLAALTNNVVPRIGPVMNTMATLFTVSGIRTREIISAVAPVTATMSLLIGGRNLMENVFTSFEGEVSASILKSYAIHLGGVPLDFLERSPMVAMKDYRSSYNALRDGIASVAFQLNAAAVLRSLDRDFHFDNAPGFRRIGTTTSTLIAGEMAKSLSLPQLEPFVISEIGKMMDDYSTAGGHANEANFIASMFSPLYLINVNPRPTPADRAPVIPVPVTGNYVPVTARIPRVPSFNVVAATQSLPTQAALDRMLNLLSPYASNELNVDASGRVTSPFAKISIIRPEADMRPIAITLKQALKILSQFPEEVLRMGIFIPGYDNGFAPADLWLRFRSIIENFHEMCYEQIFKWDKLNNVVNNDLARIPLFLNPRIQFFINSPLKNYGLKMRRTKSLALMGSGSLFVPRILMPLSLLEKGPDLVEYETFRHVDSVLLNRAGGGEILKIPSQEYLSAPRMCYFARAHFVGVTAITLDRVRLDSPVLFETEIVDLGVRPNFERAQIYSQALWSGPPDVRDRCVEIIPASPGHVEKIAKHGVLYTDDPENNVENIRLNDEYDVFFVVNDFGQHVPLPLTYYIAVLAHARFSAPVDVRTLCEFRHPIIDGVPVMTRGAFSRVRALPVGREDILLSFGPLELDVVGSSVILHDYQKGELVTRDSIPSITFINNSLDFDSRLRRSDLTTSIPTITQLRASSLDFGWRDDIFSRQSGAIAKRYRQIVWTTAEVLTPPK
jgi:hypothetical protein